MPKVVWEQINNQKEKRCTKQRGARDGQGAQEADNRNRNSSAVAQTSHRYPLRCLFPSLLHQAMRHLSLFLPVFSASRSR